MGKHYIFARRRNRRRRHLLALAFVVAIVAASFIHHPEDTLPAQPFVTESKVWTTALR